MSSKAPVFVSTPVVSTAAPMCARWSAVTEAEAYIYCRLSVPLRIDGPATLVAGGLDLMMERYVIAADQTAVTETSVRAGHRMVVCRIPGRKLVPVSGLTLAPPQGGSTPPPLNASSVATSSWWSIAPGAKGIERSAARARIEEPNATGAPPAFIERPMTIREGRARKEAVAPEGAGKHASPTEAWQARVMPRMEKRRVTDAAALPESQMTPPATQAPQTPSATPPPLQWVLLGSKALIRCQALTPNLRRLRGYFRVGFTGVAERAWLQTQADRCDVPLDGIVAMAPNHPGFWNALGSPMGSAAIITLAEDETAEGARRVEATTTTLTDVCDALIAEKRGEDSQPARRSDSATLTHLCDASVAKEFGED